MFLHQVKSLDLLFKKIAEPENDIDPESKRIETLMNMLTVLRQKDENICKIFEIFLRRHYRIKGTDNIILEIRNALEVKNSKSRIARLNAIGKAIEYSFLDANEMISLLEDPILFYLKKRYNNLTSVFITKTDAKEKYKLTNSDLENIPFVEFVHGAFYHNCRNYYLEEVKDYVNRNYGKKKLEERILKSIERKEKMRQARRIMNEKKNEMKMKRKQKIIDLLAESNLYYDSENSIAENFIEGNGEFDEFMIKQRAIEIINEKTGIENRRCNLIEELAKYNCNLNHTLFWSAYIYENNISLEYVVENARENKFLIEKTNYLDLFKRRVLENYDGILGERITMRKYDKYEENEDDIYKTYAVELYIDKIMDEDVPPIIKWRIEEAMKKREFHRLFEEDLIKRREEKKKNNLENYKNKKLS